MNGVNMDNLIRKAAEDLTAAKNVAALTGAGISIESGIPPFRGKGGLWERFDPMEFAHIDAFLIGKTGKNGKIKDGYHAKYRRTPPGGR
jgi:NAD-dependent SIR2 family protein deacetylase